MRTLFEDIWTWSVYSKEKRLDFNGYVIGGHEGTVVVDPPPMGPDALEKLGKATPPFDILLTNKDHKRDSETLRARLEARVWIHQADADLLDAAPDSTFRDGQDLPVGLRAVHIPGGKSPGETAFFLDRHGGVLVLGDALIGTPLGELSLLPAAKYEDVEAARKGIEVLMELAFETVLVGDGASIFRNGRDAVRRFLQEA